MGREGAGGGAWRWGVDWDGGAVPTTGRDQRGCGGSMGDLGASPFRAWKFRDTPIGPIVIDPLGGRGGGRSSLLWYTRSERQRRIRAIFDRFDKVREERRGGDRFWPFWREAFGGFWSKQVYL